MTKPWLGMWESGHLPGTGKLQREKPLGKPWVWVKDGVTILLNPANPIQTKHFRSQDLATEILTLHLHISVCKERLTTPLLQTAHGYAGHQTVKLHFTVTAV